MVKKGYSYFLLSENCGLFSRGWSSFTEGIQNSDACSIGDSSLSIILLLLLLVQISPSPLRRSQRWTLSIW